MKTNEISKYIALILRHKTETIGISLDEHGWANLSYIGLRLVKRKRMVMISICQ